MDQVYYLEQDNTARPLQRIACRSEDKELQSLLERNLHLLPASQISPDKQLRWLLVKREMPVISPALGEASWSIDFLLLDQDGVPTLVECKRKDDPRSKREVIGQMLDYAANGKNYWTASDFRSHAQNTAGGEALLGDLLNRLTQSDISASSFFELAEQNLRRSRMRLIFFLEESSFELRSIVEFLNGQFKETEVLIVEARQYSYGESRIVIPWVFGFTEEARVAKKEAKAEATRVSSARGEAAFWDALEASLSKDERFNQVKDFFAQAALLPNVRVKWLKSGLITMPALLPKASVLGIRVNGSLELYLVNWWPSNYPQLTSDRDAAREAFAAGVNEIFGLSSSDQQDQQYRIFGPEKWLDKRSKLLDLLRKLGKLCKAADGSHNEWEGVPPGSY